MAKKWEIPPDAIPLSPEEAKAATDVVNGVIVGWMFAARSYVTIRLLLGALSEVTRIDLTPLDDKAQEVIEDFTKSMTSEIDIAGKSHWQISEVLAIAHQVLEESFERVVERETITLKPVKGGEGESP